jgi:hypothetical protein
MLDRFDDFPIHQTPEPIRQPVSGDRNAYDRYFFNGYTADGEIYFAVAFGLYPNRRVMDASLSLVRDGVQYSLHASRLAPDARDEITVGPISIEVVDPMRELRVRVAENAHPLSADLVFRARTPAVEEPRFQRHSGTRLVMDSTRFTQFGSWSGSLRLDGEQITLDPAQVLGSRDRSWGIRGVGERETGAPGAERPQFYWLWAPLNFDDLCLHFGTNEDATGTPWHQSACTVPLLGAGDSPVEAGGIERMASVEHRVRWRPGTRRADSMQIVFHPRGGGTRTVELEPLLDFQMLGIGYLHPEWGHGVWKGEDALGFESWKLSELDPMQPQHLHVQALCRAHFEGRTGTGILEQLVIGAHAPSGFEGLLDGAS